MDNLKVDITAEDEVLLKKALEICFSEHGKATHYLVARIGTKVRYYGNPASDHMPENVSNAPNLHVSHYEDYEEDAKGHLTLFLCWANVGKALPYPMNIQEAFEFCRGWLKNAGDPGEMPGHDGDSKRGFRVFTTGNPCHVYPICAVQCVWAVYGK